MHQTMIILSGTLVKNVNPLEKDLVRCGKHTACSASKLEQTSLSYRFKKNETGTFINVRYLDICART